MDQNGKPDNKQKDVKAEQEKVGIKGIENKSFESDEANDKTVDSENVNQSQIEMGLTESMKCTNKL